MMKRIRTITSSILLFGIAGPPIGALVVLASRGWDFPSRLVPLSYAFGIVPALIAGATYGVIRSRAGDSPPPWHIRALRGVGAGLIGSLVFVSLGSAYTLLTASISTLRGELGFYRLMIVAGALAGAVCAVLMGHVGRAPRHSQSA